MFESVLASLIASAISGTVGFLVGRRVERPGLRVEATRPPAVPDAARPARPAVTVTVRHHGRGAVRVDQVTLHLDDDDLPPSVQADRSLTAAPLAPSQGWDPGTPARTTFAQVGAVTLGPTRPAVAFVVDLGDVEADLRAAGLRRWVWGRVVLSGRGTAGALAFESNPVALLR